MRPGPWSERDSDTGHFLMIMLSGYLAGLRDRLALDGYYPAAELVADLVDITDDFLAHPPERCEEDGMIW
ncbi:MAG: hypothetical protein ACLGIB_08795 [Actinomycetota bacterium]